jgi:type I restriction enzyme, S subunit
MSRKTKTTATKEEATPALVPKLRFPEFRKSEGWRVRLMGDLFSYRQEAGVTGLPLLSLMDKEGIVPQENSNRKNNSNSDKSKYLRVVPGDIAYNTMRMWEGRSAHVGMEGLVSPAYTVCEPKADVHSGLFSYYFKTQPLIEQFRRYSQGLVKDTLNLKYAAFSQILVPTPTFLEQQKIAECLSSVDELIVAQARKLNALKTHKKGLMEQLFPREGETQPRLRFPEFQNAGEWEPDTLENLCSAKISYGIVQAGPHVPNGMPYIKSTDLNSKLCLANLARTSEAIAQKYRRSEVVPGDIVFSLRGNIGVAQILPKGIPVANLTQGTARIRTKGSPEFYFYALRSPSVNSRIQAVGKGSTFQEISLDALRNTRLFHPKPHEQQRIAACLTSLDDLITAQTQKLEALKTHKKGLMQQLFPSPEEVEG